jgi:hypothetical protein
VHAEVERNVDRKRYTFRLPLTLVEEEKNIRPDPAARVTDLLKEFFGKR